MKPLNYKERRRSIIMALVWTLFPMLLVGFSTVTYYEYEKEKVEVKEQNIVDGSEKLSQYKTIQERLDSIIKIYANLEQQDDEDYISKGSEASSRIGAVIFEDTSLENNIKDVLLEGIKYKSKKLEEEKSARIEKKEEKLGKEKEDIKDERDELEGERSMRDLKDDLKASIRKIHDALFNDKGKKKDILKRKVLFEQYEELIEICSCDL